MRRISPWVALLFGATACSHEAKPAAGENSNVLLTSDFENLAGWLGDAPSLTAEKAHSGQYSLKVDPSVEYSLSYSKTLARLSPQRVNKMRLSAWSFLTQPGSSASLVCQITHPERPGENVYYEKIDLTEAGAWTQVSKVLTLPPALDPASTLKIYLWRGQASSAVYLDDIALTVEP